MADPTSPPAAPRTVCPECGGACAQTPMLPYYLGVPRLTALVPVSPVSVVNALVCATCGFMRLYAEPPNAVLPTPPSRMGRSRRPASASVQRRSR